MISEVPVIVANILGVAFNATLAMEAEEKKPLAFHSALAGACASAVIITAVSIDSSDNNTPEVPIDIVEDGDFQDKESAEICQLAQDKAQEAYAAEGGEGQIIWSCDDAKLVMPNP